MEKTNVVEVFLNVEAHRLTAEIIRKFSTNKKDIRDLALSGLNLKACKAILDLGCGFGFFTQALKGRVHPEAFVRGIDIIEAYGPLFLKSCEDAGLRGAFSAEGVHSIKKLEARQFDLILCSYALYFFPEIIPDISGALTSKGHFITITHSSENMSDLIDATKEALKEKKMLSGHALPIEGIIRRFSSENGLQLLSPWFGGIRSVDYPNNLVFQPDDLPRIVEYFQFKSPFFLSGTAYSPETVTGLLRKYLEKAFLSRKQFTISKDDTVFIAEKPIRKREMKRKIKRFCPYCGGKTVTRHEEGVPRDFCEACGVFFYENPLPVVSTIVMSDRKVLLVKRGNKPYKGMWCLPTGFAEAGESIEDAALRELEEETGMQGSIVGLVHLDSARNYYYGDLLFTTFEVEATGGKLGRGGDADDVKYFPLDRIPKLAFSSNKKAIKAFIRNKSEAWAILDSFSLAMADDRTGRKKKNLLSDRLIDVIEKNAERIAEIWLDDVMTNHSTTGYHHGNREELFEKAYTLISQFGRWLGGFYRDEDIRSFYMELGKERNRAGFMLSEVLSTLSLLKKHMWEFALSRGMWQKTLDIYMALELDKRIVVFFDKAAFYTTKGYERES